MQLGREEKYDLLVNVLRFNPREENVRFLALEDDIRNGLSVGEIHIKGDFRVKGLEDDSSVFGLKEDGAPFIKKVNELEEDTTFVLKSNPRIVHKGELNVNREENVEDVFVAKPRLGIGYNEKGEVLLVALESTVAAKQLGQLMLELGCIEAINVYANNIGKIEYKGIPAEETKAETKVEKKPIQKKRNKKK